MDSETLLKLGADPDAWLRKSATLRLSADVLWEAFSEALTVWTVRQRANSRDSDEAFDRAFGHLMSAKMLYGLALETAFKAKILRDRPHDVEFRLTADGSGKIHTAELKQLGVSLGAGHNLVRLAEIVGVFRTGAGAIFQYDSDFQAVRAILQDLGEITVWAGRYPIPTQSGTVPPMPAQLPAKVLGHYMRDWLDPLLNHYQSADTA